MEYAHKVQSVRAMLCGVLRSVAHKVQSVRAMLCGVSTTLSGSQGTVSESNVMWS